MAEINNPEFGVRRLDEHERENRSIAETRI